MLAAKSNVKIDFCAGGSVISSGYCYFSFFHVFYKVLTLKFHLNFKVYFLIYLSSLCNNHISDCKQLSQLDGLSPNTLS